MPPKISAYSKKLFPNWEHRIPNPIVSDGEERGIVAAIRGGGCGFYDKVWWRRLGAVAARSIYQCCRRRVAPHWQGEVRAPWGDRRMRLPPNRIYNFLFFHAIF